MGSTLQIYHLNLLILWREVVLVNLVMMITERAVLGPEVTLKMQLN